MLRSDCELREKAFAEFARIARAEQPNGAENLALFRLVPRFSTAPKAETDQSLVLMRYWSRNGHGQWLIEEAAALKSWAVENGYQYVP